MACYDCDWYEECDHTPCENATFDAKTQLSGKGATSENRVSLDSSRDYISRQAALNLAYELDLSDTGNPIQVIVVDAEEIKKLPSAQPEIIRCKDCKWSEPVSGYLVCGAWEAKAVDKDDFCSDAERREDAE